MTTVCDSCGLEWPEDRFNRTNSAPDTCFKCRVAGLGVTYGYRGRKQFHDQTIKEHNDRLLKDSRDNGYEPVPVNTKASHGGAYANKTAQRLGGVSV